MPYVNPMNIALSGLRVAQAQISVTSNNVANVSTEGYTRKVLEQYSTVIDTEGTGVSFGLVQRRVDTILLKDYRTQTALTSGLETSANYLNQIQDFHGPPDSEQSLSAFISQLKDSFSQLSNQPENAYLLNATYTKATQVVEKFGSFSARLTEMRNNVQSEMIEAVSQINSLTTQIARLNAAIKVSTALADGTAELEDQRDLAIKKLAKEMDISYFKTSENVVVVMTRRGELMADTQATELNFSPTALGPASYYPASAAEIRLGDPTTGIDITAQDTLGGRLGALTVLRDDTLPQFQAQADEVAHKMALRFHNEGLDLFTLSDGTIPTNTPTSYVGFSADMQVNPSIVTDHTLLRKGTNPASTVQSGSSEVLRKIVEYAFGTVQYQQAQGTVDISNTVPTLFTTLSMAGRARIVADASISALNPLDTSPYINPGVEDNFTIQVGSAAAQTITITGGMTPAGLVSAINTAYPGMAQLGSGGELILTANDNITIGAGTLGAPGLSELGLEAGVTAADPPSFTIAVGRNAPTTIQILSTDTTTELLAKLNAVAGVTASLTVGGFLNIVPTEGGDITLADGTSTPLAELGVTVTNVAHTAFNSTNLGPGGNLDAEIQNATTLHDYMTLAISHQSQLARNTDTEYETEENYRVALETRFLDKSGVNLDEEMATLINVQTAYNASAKAIRVAQEMIDELMATFSR